MQATPLTPPSPLPSLMHATSYLARHVRKPDGWQPQHILHRKDEVVARCGISVALYLDELLGIMGGAFKVRCWGGWVSG